MVLRTRSNGLVVLLPLALTMAANAVPAARGSRGNLIACAWLPRSDTHISFVQRIRRTTEELDSHLAGIAAEFLKPPVGFEYTGIRVSHKANVSCHCVAVAVVLRPRLRFTDIGSGKEVSHGGDLLATF